MEIIREGFEQFLAEQEKRLKSDTYQNYGFALELFESYLNGYASQHLPEELGRRYEQSSDEDRQFCDIFDFDQVNPSDFSGFLGYFMIRKVLCSPEQIKTTCRVMKKLVMWLREQGYFTEEKSKEALQIIRDYSAVLPDASRLSEILGDYVYGGKRVDPEECSEFLEGMFMVEQVESGVLHLVDTFGMEETKIRLPVPEECAALCREGWEINLELGKTVDGWRILASGNVYP